MSPDGALPAEYLEDLARFLSEPRPKKVLDRHLSRYRTEYQPMAVLAPGLSPEELGRAEEAFGCPFPPDFRSLLQAFVPTGRWWADWREPERESAALLERLRDLAAFDVERNDFWHPGWGARPDLVADAVAVATKALDEAPPLLLIGGHRYLTAVPCEAGNPVISMSQFTDTIYYGYDLADYFHHELGAPRPEGARNEPREVPFWSWVIESTYASGDDRE